MRVAIFGGYWEQGGGVNGISSKQTEISRADTLQHMWVHIQAATMGDQMCC